MSFAAFGGSEGAISFCGAGGDGLGFAEDDEEGGEAGGFCPDCRAHHAGTANNISNNN